MRTAVVTVVAGRHDHLRAQRAALARRPPGVHVVVAMGDARVHDVVAEQPDLPSVVLDVPVGCTGLPLAAARNAGARRALADGAELLVFLDVDCLPGAELLCRYTEAAAARPDALLSGAVTYLPPGTDWTPERLAAARNPHPARPAPAPGALHTADRRLFWSLSFALRAATWQHIGGFDEAYVGYGGEDTDFGQRAGAAGTDMLWVGGAEAFHQHHSVSDPPVEHVEAILRNGALFAQRWGWWPMGGWLERFEQQGRVRRTQTGWARPARVAAAPPRHPYVDAVLPAPVLADRTVEHHRDPLFDPGTDLTGVDLVHVHFGYDHLSVEELRAWLAALDRAGVALVLTVHDLRNPHHDTPDAHEAHLRELLGAAAAVTTLTTGAAEQTQHRFGVRPQVIAHPTLLDVVAGPVATEPGLVVVHLKSLRRNLVDPVRIVATAAAGAADGGGRLRVDVHPDALDRLSLRSLARPGVEIAVHDRFDDDELHAYLARAHVSVLPNRFGTHSGWLELCRDLGTRVVTPSCGFYLDQWPDAISYVNDEEHGLDDADLRRAVARAVTEPAPPPADRADRLTERDAIRAAHREVYDRVLRR